MDEENSLVVDDAPCEINTLLEDIEQTSSFSLLYTKWPDLAQKLNVNQVDSESLKMRNDLSLNCILQKILRYWKAKTGKQATIAVLCEAFANCSLTDIAERLQNKYGRSTTAPTAEGSGILGHIPKYYITRTISRKSQLKLEIFSEAVKDVFIISGMGQADLTVLANRQHIDLSRNQRWKINVRFVLYESDEHVKDIFKACLSPAHRIEKRLESFYWISSRGSLELIRRFIDQEEEIKHTETDFVEKVFVNFNPTPILITASASMGKSLLCSSLACQIETKYPERHVLKKVLKDVTNASPMDVLKWVHSKIHCDQGEACAKDIELFLDGYDEILPNQLDQTNKSIKALKEISNIRLTVTSRPHMKTELEDTLGVLTYDILAFDWDDQIKFLQKLWMSNGQDLDIDELKTVPSELLRELESKTMTNKKQRDLAGLPGFCKVLAEKVDSTKSALFSNLNKRRVDVQLNLMLPVYETFMDLLFYNNPRLENSENLQDHIKDNHVRKAFEFLFPKYISIAPNKHRNVTKAQMSAVGLIDYNAASSTSQFLHDTFAEFLIAEYVVKNMNQLRECAEFLKVGLSADDVKTIITKTTSFTTTDRLLPETYGVDHNTFKYPVLAYFINGHLEKTERLDPTMVANVPIRGNDDKFAHNVLSASIAYNLPNCFALFLNLKPPVPLSEKETSNLLELAACCGSSVDMLQKIIEIVEKNGEVQLKDVMMERPLRIAAQRGYYTPVTTFINKCLDVKYYNLLYNCLEDSKDDTDDVIRQKIEIVKLACGYDRQVMEPKYYQGSPPSLKDVKQIHPQLLSCLLKQ